MALNIADFFFCEELSRVVDQETGAQWLLSRSMNAYHPGTSVQQSRSPDQSPAAPGSLCSMSCDVKGVVPATGHHGKHISSTSFSSSLSSMDLFSLDRAEPAILDLDLAFKSSAPDLDAPCSLKSDPSMFGLLFTDAAHHALDRLMPA